MAIIDTTDAKQSVSCDLCGITFEREPRGKNDWGLGGYWKDVSISVYPNVVNSLGEKGLIRIEHACDGCRKKFLDESRLVISKLKTIPEAK